MVRQIVAGVALTLLATSGIGAQAHQHRGQDSVPSMSTMEDMMMGHGMMGQGIGTMASGGPGPTALLRMRDALDLSDEQVETLESLRADLQSQMQGRMAAMIAAHQAISAALEGEAPDWEAYQESLRAAADIMGASLEGDAAELIVEPLPKALEDKDDGEDGCDAQAARRRAPGIGADLVVSKSHHEAVRGCWGFGGTGPVTATNTTEGRVKSS